MRGTRNKARNELESLARAGAGACLERASKLRRDAAGLSDQQLKEAFEEEDVESAVEASLWWYALAVEARDRYGRSRKGDEHTLRRKSISSLVRAAQQPGASDDLMEELDHRARDPLELVMKKQPGEKVSWSTRAFEREIARRRQQIERYAARDLIDKGWEPSGRRLGRLVRERLKREQTRLRKGWEARARWLWQDGKAVYQWKEGGGYRNTDVPAAVDRPSGRLSFLASERPFWRHRYERLLTGDPIAAEIFSRWLEQGRSGVGVDGVLYLRALSLARFPKLNCESTALLYEILKWLWSPRVLKAQRYYGDRIPKETDRDTAIHGALIKTLFACSPEILRAFPYPAGVSPDLGIPFTLFFRVALCQALGVRIPELEKVRTNREFCRAFEAEWRRLMTTTVSVPYRRGVLVQGLQDSTFGFDVVPLISRGAFERYGTLPRRLKDGRITREVSLYLSHQACGAFEPLMDRYWQGGLKGAFRPLRAKTARSAAWWMADEVDGDVSRHRRPASDMTDTVFDALAGDFDPYFPRPKDNPWRYMGTVSVAARERKSAPAAGGYGEEFVYPFSAYIDRMLRHRVEGATVGRRPRRKRPLSKEQRLRQDQATEGGENIVDRVDVGGGVVGADYLDPDNLGTCADAEGRWYCSAVELSRATGIPLSTIRSWDSVLQPVRRKDLSPTLRSPSLRRMRMYAVDDIGALQDRLKEAEERGRQRLRHIIEKRYTITVVTKLLSEKLGRSVTARQVRYLERRAGIHPGRDRHGNRQYTEKDIHAILDLLGSTRGRRD